MTVVTVCTDASVHRMWVAEGTDLYVVCSPLAAATLRRYDAAAPVTPDQLVGVPDSGVVAIEVRGARGVVPAEDQAAARAGRGRRPEGRTGAQSGV